MVKNKKLGHRHGGDGNGERGRGGEGEREGNGERERERESVCGREGRNGTLRGGSIELLPAQGDA